MSSDQNDRPPIAIDKLQLTEALGQLPPGRTLAAEYLKQRRVIEEQQKQIVRAIELRIEADKRAGRKNVYALEVRIQELEQQRTVLVDALKAAPWGSCRDLSEAVQAAIRENEAHDVRDELAECLDVGLEPSRFQEGTIVHVTTEGHPLPRLGKIVVIHSDQFHMFEVEILATRKRESFAACFLEPA